MSEQASSSMSLIVHSADKQEKASLICSLLSQEEERKLVRGQCQPYWTNISARPLSPSTKLMANIPVIWNVSKHWSKKGQKSALTYVVGQLERGVGQSVTSQLRALKVDSFSLVII